MDSALHRIPALADTGIRKFYNGPESFTPDNQFLMGEAPNVRGFFGSMSLRSSASARYMCWSCSRVCWHCASLWIIRLPVNGSWT